METDERNAKNGRDVKTSVDIMLEEAVQAHRAGMTDKARELYEKVLDLNPDHPDALYLLGGVHYARSQPSLAEKTIGRAIEAAPDRDYFYVSLALALIAQGKTDDALDAFQAALAINPENPETHNTMGKILAKQGAPSEAECAFRKAVELDGEYLDAYYNLASLLMKRAEPDSAAKVCQEALDRCGVSVETFNRLGKAFFAAEIFDRATAAFLQALGVDPNDSRTYQNLGAAYEAQGLGQKAAEAFERSIELAPDRAEACLDFGNYLVARKRTGEAIRYFRRAAELRPDFASAYNGMGIALKGEGRLEEALCAYQKAVEIDPGHAEIYNNLGVALASAGRAEEAEEAYRRAVELDQNNPHLFQNLGITLKGLGKLQAALVAFQHAAALSPGFADAFHNMGSTLIEMGRPDHALAALKKAAELDPSNHSAKYMVSALSGEGPESAPPEYVKELFDQYSQRFDRHLVEKLGYRTPEVLKETLESAAGKPLSFSNVLDLGCGTGLSGDVFRDSARRLDGVDISKDMVRVAEGKNIYDRLEVAEINEYLDECRDRYDLAVAADVFVYAGDLSRIFSGVGRCLEKGGYFAFSTENCDGDSYRLGASGRFAHGQEYVRKLALETGFDVVAEVPAVIRQEDEKNVQGMCYVLRSGI